MIWTLGGALAGHQPDCLMRWWASPRRRMACPSHPASFISCFHNDISLVTGYQLAWLQTEEPSVTDCHRTDCLYHRPRGGKPEQGHRSSQIDRATTKPPLPSPIVYWTGRQVNVWLEDIRDIYGLRWRQAVLRGVWWSPIVLLASGWTTRPRFRLMVDVQYF
jgi:hypothetical protein